jgi:lipopolysaccharide biosynthesis glycosyltransferase
VNTEGDRLAVAVTTDRGYLPYAATTLLAAARRTTELRLDLHLVHTDASDEDCAAVVAMIGDAADVHVHQLGEEQLATLPSRGDDLGGRITWARLLLPQLLPETARCVYLDGDLLVASSLAPLADVDLEGNPIGAVRNVVEPEMRGYVESLGLADHLDYFNAGVMVLDLDALRGEDVVGAAARLIEERGEAFTWWDQDALNIVFEDRWTAIPARWNAQNCFWGWRAWSEEVLGAAEVAQAVHDPAIRHFEGPGANKPWYALAHGPYVDEWRAVLADTPWGDEPLKDGDGVYRLFRHLPRKVQPRAWFLWNGRRATRVRSLLRAG